MKRLNKRGWGLRTAIGFTALFCFCLLVAVIGINKMAKGFQESEKVKDLEIDNYNSSIDEEESEDYYIELENEVYNVLKDYINDNEELKKSDYKIVNINKLIVNGYLTSFSDENGNECSGYVEIFDNGKNQSVYINCKGYKTIGYDERKDKK